MSSNSVTVSQALRAIKRLKGKLAEHQTRATNAVSYEAGKKPTFDFETERAARAKAQDELIRLEASVARANALTMIAVDDRQLSVAHAIRRLQEVKGDIAWISSLPIKEGTEREREIGYDDATGRNVARTREVTYVASLGEVARVAEIDALKSLFERLNDAVETANHRTVVEVEAATPPSAA